MFWETVKGIESLARGCPFYKHSKCEEVPWPRVNATSMYSSSSTAWKNVLGEKKYKEELDKLNNLSVPDTNEVISHHITLPSRVTYSSRLPYFNLSECSPGNYSLYDSGSWTGEGSLAPGSCLLTGFRIKAGAGWTFNRVSLSISGRVVQEITFELLCFLEKYLGFRLTEKNDHTVIYTIPFFFSRDIAYALPLFVVGSVKFNIQCQCSDINTYCDLTILHTREEIKQIRLKHILRTDHLAERQAEASKWMYMNSFWRDAGDHIGACSIQYDGSKDEELKGIFWEIHEGEMTDVNVSVFYTYSEGNLSFIDSMPQDLVSRIELERILPSMVGGSRVPRSDNCGGYMFSTYFDDGDCSPGVTPRNGNLFIEFSKPIKFRTYIYSSRDWVIYK